MSSEVLKSSENQQQEESKPKEKLIGFAAHPENINRRGAPKKQWTVRELLLEVAEETLEMRNKVGQVTGRKLYKEALAKKLWKKAVDGDVQAIKEIIDRIDGKAVQKNILEGNINVESKVVIRSYDPNFKPTGD